MAQEAVGVMAAALDWVFRALAFRVQGFRGHPSKGAYRSTQGSGCQGM